MLPDNYFADTAGGLLGTVFEGLLALALVPLAALTDALLAFLTGLFPF